VTRADVNHENRHIHPSDSILAASTWRVTSPSRTASAAPKFLGFSPPFRLLPTWCVTSGRVTASPQAPWALGRRARDAELVVGNHQRVPARDLSFVEPALTDCDALVDIRRVHTTAASPATAEMSNDNGCSAPSSASPSSRTTTLRPAQPPPRPSLLPSWIHHRCHDRAVRWLQRIHSPP
jgi:hypothetical protein